MFRMPPGRRMIEFRWGCDTSRKSRMNNKHLVSAMMVIIWAVTCCPLVYASSAAGTETLVGIVGKDFVLLGADSSVSQSIALTASNMDKIAPLVEPFPDADLGPFSNIRQQQAVVAAAAGDTADSDRLLSYLKAIGTVEEYSNGGLGSDVRCISLEDDSAGKDPSARSNVLWKNDRGGLDVRSMAHLARRCIWERMRSRTPYRICLLMAGMMWESDGISLEKNPNQDSSGNDQSSDRSKFEKGNESRREIPGAESSGFTSETVQKQVQQAWKRQKSTSSQKISNEDEQDSNASKGPCYQPHLYWLDEYGSLQKIEYGAHGHGSNFLLSILDQGYKPDLSRAEAIQLMNECFRELRNRYVINSPEAPCIKCVDAKGVRLIPHTNTKGTGDENSSRTI